MRLLSGLVRAGLMLTLAGGVLLLAAGFGGRFLPTGELFAFDLVSYTGLSGTSDIILLEVNRGLAVTVTRNQLSGIRAAVAPDKTQIAYGGEEQNIFIYDVRSLTTRQIAPLHSRILGITWSPDGQQLAYSNGTTIFTTDIVSGTVSPMSTAFSSNYPDWSPDGEQIVFSGRYANGQHGLFVMDANCAADCASPQPLLALPSQGGDSQPAWSPDGKWVLFVSDRAGGSGLYLASTACLREKEGCTAQNPRSLIADMQSPIFYPAWSEDGGRIFFTAGPKIRREVFALDFDCDLMPEGCILHQLTWMRN